MQRLGPPTQKKKKTVLDSGLSLCTDWVFDFVQEMGDIKLAPQEAGVIQEISSLVLNCNANTRFPQKEDKNVLENGLSLCFMIGCLTLCKWWER